MRSGRALSEAVLGLGAPPALCRSLRAGGGHSHTQLGLLPDHWLFRWQVMARSPTSSKAAWHSKVRVSPCRKLPPVRRP